MRNTKEKPMSRILFTILAVFSLAGCVSPKFAVTEADTRFSEKKNPLFLSENNRISTKSIAGGMHIDEKGVYLNPFISKHRDTGAVLFLGLNVINKTDYDTTHGGVNQLGLIREVVFRFPSGELITLEVTNQENRSSDTIWYNSLAGYASYDKWETGSITITKQQLRQLASATALSCKIVGSSQSVIYEETEIAPEFLSNLKQFYETYVQ